MALSSLREATYFPRRSLNATTRRLDRTPAELRERSSPGKEIDQIVTPRFQTPFLSVRNLFSLSRLSQSGKHSPMTSCSG